MTTAPTSLAVTVVGHDRPGIIAQTAAALADCGMNLEDSSMTLLRGHFAMTLICTGAADVAAVEAALADLCGRIAGGRCPGGTGRTGRRLRPGPSYLITVHGADRLGIVARLTGVVAAAGGNITDLSTRLAGELYVLIAEAELQPGSDPDAARPPVGGGRPPSWVSTSACDRSSATTCDP